MCPEFRQWREQAGKQLRNTVEEHLGKLEVEGDCRDKVLLKAEFFYTDDSEFWPLKESYYYLGHVPKLSNLLPQSLAKSGKLIWERMVHGTYCDWHNSSVRLA